MAAPRLLTLSRTTKQTLTFSLLSRPFSSATSTTTFNFSLLRLRPVACAIGGVFHSPALTSTALRAFATNQAQNSLSDNNPNWSNRPPKETILLDGCDFEHWLVVVDTPPETATRDEIIDTYIKTLAQIIGSEEEARMKIYSVSTKHYFAFGALVSEELSLKLKELPNVRWVLPDSYLDVRNKDYGGEPFINGQAVPYDPKYHEEWVRNNAKAQERNRRNDRPRNADRSRNFDRRQQSGSGPPNMGGRGGNTGGPSNFQGGAPPNNAGYAQNIPPNNAGYAQIPPNNAGYAPNMPPNNPGNAPNMPHNNPGNAPNMPHNNPGYTQSNNLNDPRRGGGPPPNYGGQGNPGYTGPNYQQSGGMPPYQNAPMGNQNYAPHNSNMGGQSGGAYQPQDVPGRDVPNY